MSKKEAEASLKILTYMEQQNRPYSVNDIFMNLHKEIGKTAVQKMLDALVLDGSIKEKTYGKQKVYVASQERFPPLDDIKLKEMDAKINALSDDVKAKLKTVQDLESSLKMLGSSLTTEEVQKQILQYESDVSELELKLNSLQKNQVVISQQEKERVENEHTKMVKEWKKRRRMALDILDAILEGYPKSKKQLYEDVGIETDQDAGVTIPDK